MLVGVLIYLVILMVIFLALRHGVYLRLHNGLDGRVDGIVMSFCNKVLMQVFIRPVRAQELHSQLQELLIHPNVNLQKIELVSFKFYTSLVMLLIKYSREFGSPLTGAIKELMRAIRSEEKALIVVWQSFWGGVWQFVTVSAITWGFMFALKEIIQHDVSAVTYLKVGLLQILGVILYVMSFVFSYLRVMRGFDKMFNALYSIRSLLKAGLPLSMVLKKSDLHSTPQHGHFSYIKQRLNYMTSQSLYQGGEVLEQLSEVIDDLWGIQEDYYKRFTKLLVFIKFSLLMIFFVPSYFLVTLDLISGPMGHNT